MKHNVLLITLCCAGAFAAGCNQDQTTSQQLEKAKSETKQAAEDMRDYTYAQKDEFVQKMQSQLAALNQDLDKLSAKVESSSDTVKVEAKPKLQALRDQAGKLNSQLDEIKNSSASTWDKVKAETKKAYDSLAEKTQQARQWLSDKIAP